MKNITRRSFGKIAGAAFLLGQPDISLDLARIDTSSIDIPEVISGRRLSPEERELASKFLQLHSRQMEALRTHRLLNSLAPATSFRVRRWQENGNDR